MIQVQTNFVHKTYFNFKLQSSSRNLPWCLGIANGELWILSFCSVENYSNHYSFMHIKKQMHMYDNRKWIKPWRICFSLLHSALLVHAKKFPLMQGAIIKMHTYYQANQLENLRMWTYIYFIYSTYDKLYHLWPQRQSITIGTIHIVRTFFLMKKIDNGKHTVFNWWTQEVKKKEKKCNNSNKNIL